MRKTYRFSEEWVEVYSPTQYLLKCVERIFNRSSFNRKITIQQVTRFQKVNLTLFKVSVLCGQSYERSTIIIYDSR